MLREVFFVQEGKHGVVARKERRGILCSMHISDIILDPLKQSITDMAFGQLFALNVDDFCALARNWCGLRTLEAVIPTRELLTSCYKEKVCQVAQKNVKKCNGWSKSSGESLACDSVAVEYV